jgi:hypothetical protein
MPTGELTRYRARYGSELERRLGRGDLNRQGRQDRQEFLVRRACCRPEQQIQILATLATLASWRFNSFRFIPRGSGKAPMTG